jgi:cysteine desulfurase
VPDIKYVYADCAASAPILPCAAYALIALGQANPNSAHCRGREARTELEHARETIAECINAEPSEIAFTPSATAACRFAVNVMNIGLCSDYEHKAVWEHTQFTVNYCLADASAYAHMLANNETGEIYYEKVRELSQKYSVFTDATAAIGQMPVDVQYLGVAALAAGAHKFGGYPGIGFIYLKGGVDDDDTFPGTPPVALAVAMAEALKYRTEHMRDATYYLLTKRMNLADRILAIPGSHINCHEQRCLPNILSVRFDGVNARELLTMLDARGVYASAGSACTADQDTPSRVLLASGLTEEQALSTIRLSFCPETTPEEFSSVADALRCAVSDLRRLTV